MIAVIVALLVIGVHAGLAATSTDKTPPTISNILPSGWINTSSATLTASYSDASGVDSASASVYLDGKVRTGCTATASAISCPSGQLADGSHTTTVSVADVYGNTGTGTGSFSVDTTPPAITSVSPSGTITTDTATIQVSYTETGSGIDSANSFVTLDNAPLSGCSYNSSAVNCPVSGLVDGTHTIGGRIYDNAGNYSDISGSFTVSLNTAPSLTMSYVSATRNGSQVTVIFEVTNSTASRISNVRITGNTTSGATLATALPISLGNIRAQASRAFTVTYDGTTAGQTFTTAWSGTSGNGPKQQTYSYPPISITAP